MLRKMKWSHMESVQFRSGKHNNSPIMELCYEHHPFITSNLQYIQNTPDLTPELLYSRPSPDFGQHFPFPDYNSITFLVLLFHVSVLLYPPFDNSDISIIVPHSCLIVPSCIQIYCHTLPDLLFVQTSPLA